MILKLYIKKYSVFFKYLPWLERSEGITLLTKIYLRPDIYDNLSSAEPTSYNIAVMMHEETHIKSIRREGWLKFGILYLFSGAYRFNEELLANKAAFKYLKKHGSNVDLERKACILSSWLYLWPVSYAVALKQVEKAWNEA